MIGYEWGVNVSLDVIADQCISLTSMECHWLTVGALTLSGSPWMSVGVIVSLWGLLLPGDCHFCSAGPIDSQCVSLALNSGQWLKSRGLK